MRSSPGQLLYIFLIFFILILPCRAQEKPFTIYFVSPQTDDSHFWGMAHEFARACARDLNIRFKVFYSKNNDRHGYVQAFSRAVHAGEKPDALIGIFYRFTGEKIFNLARSRQIPVFMVNTNVPDDETEVIGRVRGKYKEFIGHMAPDEKEVGYMLAKALIQMAKSTTRDRPVEITGLSGHLESPVSINRVSGLKKAAEEEGANLRQVVYSDWSERDACSRTRGLIKRYPSLDAFWYVVDYLAIAGRKTMDDQGRILLTGGVDWKKEAVQGIKQGTIHASVGGHFTEIGFALVLLYDYLKGFDFYPETGGRIHTPMTLLTLDNIDRYYQVLVNPDWEKIDFSRYSRVLNPGLSAYDFSFETLVQYQRNPSGSVRSSP